MILRRGHTIVLQCDGPLCQTALTEHLPGFTPLAADVIRLTGSEQGWIYECTATSQHDFCTFCGWLVAEVPPLEDRLGEWFEARG